MIFEAETYAEDWEEVFKRFKMAPERTQAKMKKVANING